MWSADNHQVSPGWDSYSRRVGVELDAGDDPDDWPDSPARDQTLASLGGAKVLPVVAVQTNRQFVYAIRAAVVVA